MADGEPTAHDAEAARRERERAGADQDTRPFEPFAEDEYGYGAARFDPDEEPLGTRRISRRDRLAGAGRGAAQSRSGRGGAASRSARAGAQGRAARGSAAARSAQPRPGQVGPEAYDGAEGAQPGAGGAGTRTRDRRPRTGERRGRTAYAAHPRGRRRWARRLILAAAVLAVLVIGGAAWFFINLYQPFGASPHGRVTVVVPARDGASQIGDLLAKDGVVSSGFFFNLRAKLAGDRGKLLPGTYHLEHGMSYAAVLKVLTTPPPPVKTTDITMTPGQRRADFSRLLKKQGIKGNYYQATIRSPLLNPTAYGAPANTPSLEGFMFPDTYQLRVPVKLSALIADQLKRFKQEFATVHGPGCAGTQYTTRYDVLIIASLIEGEAQTSHDVPLVASVICNRLRQGIPLGLDATTQYATGNFTRPLTQSQLASPSPWNTRNHTGLPPTPIDNPGLTAMRAAANPPTTDYLYFVNKPCSNSLAFTASYDVFLQDVAALDATLSQNGQPPQHPCK